MVRFNIIKYTQLNLIYLFCSLLNWRIATTVSLDYQHLAAPQHRVTNSKFDRIYSMVGYTEIEWFPWQGHKIPQSIPLTDTEYHRKSSQIPTTRYRAMCARWTMFTLDY